MTSTLISFLVLTWCGHDVLRRLGDLVDVEFDSLTSIGLGFFIAAGFTIVWLCNSPFSLSSTSWMLVLLGILALTPKIFSFRKVMRPLPGATSFTEPRYTIGFLVLAVLYFLPLIAVQWSSDFLPWDAFTTWIYRAKLWVLTNQLMNLETIPEWLAAGASGYAIDAAGYPLSVSAIAAFASSVTGNWHTPSATIPWLFATIASTFLIMGLAKTSMDGHPLGALAGAALLITTPIFHIHSLVPGYADIWLQGTSGMGLAALCVWSQRRDMSTLLLSLALLSLGIFFKNEGWMWLFVGLCSLAIMTSPRRHFLVSILLIFFSIAGLTLAAFFDLGFTRTWSFENGLLFFGDLEALGVRPKNPADYFFNETVLRGNYLLLLPLYTLLVAWSVLLKKRQFYGYWLIGVAAFSCILFIFSFSSFSIYAEIGTAFNRLMLQILPILVVTICAIGGHLIQEQTSKFTSLKRTYVKTMLAQGAVLLAVSLFAAISLALWIGGETGPENGNYNSSSIKLQRASEFRSVAGDFTQTPRGYKFTNASDGIGVAAANIDIGVVQPRYVFFDAETPKSETVFFYWINTGSSQVHTTAVPASGQTLLDMSEFAQFWQQPIEEMGYLLAPEHFGDVVIHSIGQSNSLTAARTQLLNLWNTPAPLSHRVINGIDGHTPSPLNFNTILNIALFILICIGIANLSFRTKITHQKHLNIVVAITGLWLIGSAIYIKQASAFTIDLLGSEMLSTQKTDNHIVDERLRYVASKVDKALGDFREVPNSVHMSVQASDEFHMPVLSTGQGANGLYYASKLPFTILPSPGAKIEVSQLGNLPNGTVALLVLFDLQLSSFQDLPPESEMTFTLLDADTTELPSVELWLIKRK